MGRVAYHYVNSRNMYYETKQVKIVDDIHVTMCRTKISLDTLYLELCAYVTVHKIRYIEMTMLNC